MVRTKRMVSLIKITKKEWNAIPEDYKGIWMAYISIIVKLINKMIKESEMNTCTVKWLKKRLKENPYLKCKDIGKLYEIQDCKRMIFSPSAKGGWREDLQRYFRSTWEANYARYLNFIGEPWEYESEEYEFLIRRGQRFYKIDFYLPKQNKRIEIKGYMDKKSQTKLKRMKKYYPEIYKTIVVIGPEEYKAISKFRELIPGWEYRIEE